MKRSGIASIVAAAAALACLLVLAGCGGRGTDDTIANEPRFIKIDCGTLSNSNTGLEPRFTLNKSNGKYAILYVENNGSNSVVATINGQSKKTFKPDEKGRISLEVTQDFWGMDKEYEFKVVAGANGGLIDIYFEISQQDEIKD